MAMRRFLLALFVCVQALAASAQGQYNEFLNHLSNESLPLVNITVEIDRVTKPDYTPATIEIADPLMRTDGENIVTKFNAKVKYRGNTSLRYDKKSFNVKLLNEKGKSLDANILGLRLSDAWILDAMAIDRIRMRNRVNFDTWNAMSRTPYETEHAQRNGTVGRFVEVFINGKYHGLYCCTDKVNRNLLGVKKADKDEDGNPVIKGVVYKGDQWSDATKLNGYYDQSMDGASWNEWELDYPDDYPCEEAYTPLKNFIDYCVSSTDDDFKNGIDENFYWQNFVDYQVFMLSQGLRDNHLKNSFLSIVNIKKGHRIMITPWDLDCSLGGSWDGYYNYDTETLENVLTIGLYRRLWNNNVNKYQTAVADRWLELSTGVLSVEEFNKRLDAYTDQIVNSGAWQREYDMWNNNPVPLTKNLYDEISYVKDWYKRNFKNLNENIYYGIETGIGYIHNPETAPHTLYNIMGQKVDDAYKGIVIENGKKSLRK